MTVRRNLTTLLMASSALAACPALAQTAPDSQPAPSESDIIVTAQKRSESIQNVPISIQAIGTKKLDQLDVKNFNDYTKLLPSVSFQSSQPGSTTVYMRGVASGGDGNHSGSLPSVGVYLDEQPVSTIGGTIDVHVYDIARIESLAGPQGTLYGASSEAGTIRIITNKPSTAGFEGRVDGEVNTVSKGGQGGKLEGMVNIPLSSNAALRVVGFYEHDAGYIDNVAGTRSFLPQPGGITINNTPFVKKDYNDVDIAGGRAALKIDLDSNWTVTPTVLYQDQKNHGSFASDPRVGDLQVQHFGPESRHDRYVQAALTIQGKLGNWDLTYAGAYLDRKVNTSNDYVDYAEAYDQLYASVGGVAGYFYFQNAAGQTISPRQQIIGSDHFKKLSQEFRIASPQNRRFRVVAGLFYQNQSNEIHQDYQVAGLAPALSVNGQPGTLWLTQQHRTDRDYAVFGEASLDIVPTVTLTAGGRAFIYDNFLSGFYGFGRNPNGPPYNAAGSSRTGVAACFTTTGATLRDNPGGTLLPPTVAGGPCVNFGNFVGNGVVLPKEASGQGFTHRLNLTWKPTSQILLYGTWSRGFRPGGINRAGNLPPYAADYLTNYELGFKTTLFNRTLRFNGAIYQQDWKDFQFSFLGLNSLTQIQNGSNARIKGVEADINWVPIPALSLTASAAYTDAKTTQTICAASDPTLKCTGAGNFVLVTRGTRLPVTPQFKVSGIARLTIPVGSASGHLQAVVTHQSSAASDLRTAGAFGTATLSPAALIGNLPAYTTADFAAGLEFARFTGEFFLSNAFDERGQISRSNECSVCFQRNYFLPTQPRTLGFRLGAKF